MGLWIKRFLALVAAVALVVGAISVRRSWDDPASTDGSTVTTDGGDEGGGDGIVACLTDLAAWCNALDLGDVTLRVEPWSTTVASFGTATAPDGWVTFVPLGALATGYTAGSTLAGTPLVAVARADRTTAALGSCTTDNFWKCVGAQAGAPWTDLGGSASWGKVLPGIADPTKDAVGLLSLGAVSTAFFGTNQFGSTDIDNSDEFFSWFAGVVRAVPAEALGDPLALLLRRPSAVGVVATTGQHYSELAASRADEFPSTYPGPMARAEVVVMVRDGSDVPSSLSDDLAGSLLDNGWDAPSGDPTALPSGRALQRLQGLWKETRS